MIQLQVLNYILQEKDSNMLTTYDKDFFFNYTDEYNAILDHFRKYKVIPDISTMLDKFPDFSTMDVHESKDYLEHKLYEEYVYNQSATIINNSTTGFTKDATKAVNDLVAKLSKIKPPNKSYGIDIIQNAKERYDTLIDKMKNKDSYVFSTGLKELDMVIDGLQRGEELAVIFARTNNCKSWIAEKLAVSVWEAGYNVGFFSPEMSALKVGYRFDTLYKNFDNKGIQGSIEDFNSNEYKKYVNNLSSNKNVFSVTTPLDFDKKVTITALKNWILQKKLDMIVIDGITYLKNERNNGRQNTTERLTDISEDLMTLSIELGIPIVVVVQANREAARDKEGDVNDDAPELDTIRGSDGISHNASKVISVVHRKDTITLYINKNREGVVGQKLIYNYEVNTGKFTYIDNPKSGLAIDPNAPDDSENKAKQLFNDSEDIF